MARRRCFASLRMAYPGHVILSEAKHLSRTYGESPGFFVLILPSDYALRGGYETKMLLVSLNSSTAFVPSSRWPLPLAFIPPKGK